MTAADIERLDASEHAKTMMRTPSPSPRFRDAAVYWGHINSGGDLLVTADRTGFVKGGRRGKLLAIGGREIATPVDSIAWVNSQLM